MSDFVEVPAKWEEMTKAEKDDFVTAFLIGIRPLVERALVDEGTRSQSPE